MAHLAPSGMFEAEALGAAGRALGHAIESPMGWDLRAVCDGFDVIGLVATRGNESHIGIERPAFIRPVLRQVLSQQIRTYGQARTTVRSAHLKGHAFVHRLGFKPTHEADGLVHYEMKELRHA